MEYPKDGVARQFLDEIGNAFDAAEQALPSEFELNYVENRDPVLEAFSEKDIEEFVALREEFEVFWEHFNVLYARVHGIG